LFKITEPVIYYKSSENMQEISDNSVQLIVTSPPYGNIKDYGIVDQIGYSDSFEEYFTRLEKVWSECYRILEPQCRMVINIGDQYLRTSEHGRYRIISIASKIIETCKKIGFDFLGDIIWQKVSTTNTTGGCSLMGSIYYPRNGLLTYDYEHILIFKKFKGKSKKVDKERKELSKISLSEWKKWYVGHWKFPGIIQKEHIAMYPEELPYRIIRMFSFVGDFILDPFTGSGTTLKVAKSLFRKGLGYEINEKFKDIIENKIEEAKAGYFNDYQYLIYRLYQKSIKEDFIFDLEAQIRKGIIILKNPQDQRIIIDYLIVPSKEIKNIGFQNEIKAKFDENEIKNYLKIIDDNSNFDKYVIVFNYINPISVNFDEIVNFIREELKISNKIKLVLFNDIIKEDFNIFNI